MRILLADDQQRVRLALRLLLEQEPGLTIVAEAAESEGLLAQVARTRPDVVLLDWGLQGPAGEEQVAALRRARPQMSIVVLGTRPGFEELALATGADAFVSKADPAEELLAAIRALA